MAASEQQTPSYYPPGWDRERMMNAEGEELETLSAEQMDRFREGLRAHLGDQGYDDYFDEMYQRELARNSAREEASRSAGLAKANVGVETDISTTAFTEPRFLQAIRDWAQMTGQEWDQWGYVVFRSDDLDHEERWPAFRTRWDEIIDGQIRPYMSVPGVPELRRKLRFMWIEENGTGRKGIHAIAKRYGSLDVPFGLDHSVCLYVTSDSLESVLSSPLPSSARRQRRKDIPFVVAVAKGAGLQPHRDPGAVGSGDDEEEQEDLEGASFCGYFNVAVESLLEELFPLVATDSLTPYEIGGYVQDGDVWCEVGRWGIHRAGVGYWDKRSY